VLGRIDTKADDILHLGGKLRVVRQLEGAHPMRLEAVCRPDALYAAMALSVDEKSQNQALDRTSPDCR
jgi:hypothetical protein